MRFGDERESTNFTDDTGRTIGPEDELGRWFSWPLPAGLVDGLVAEGRLVRPEPGWVATAETAGG